MKRSFRTSMWCSPITQVLHARGEQVWRTRHRSRLVKRSAARCGGPDEDERAVGRSGLWLIRRGRTWSRWKRMGKCGKFTGKIWKLYMTCGLQFSLLSHALPFSAETLKGATQSLYRHTLMSLMKAFVFSASFIALALVGQVANAQLPPNVTVSSRPSQRWFSLLRVLTASSTVLLLYRELSVRSANQPYLRRVVSPMILWPRIATLPCAY